MDIKLAGVEKAREATQAIAAAGDVTKPDRNGRTMLFVAAYLGDIRFIRELLALGLQPDRADNTGITPIDYALAYGNIEAAAVMRQSLDTPKAS
jgi:ankyrin repeat protein